MPFCRDCLADVGQGRERCPACGGARIAAHAELDVLSIAHIDCDAFYAAIEKRDNPSLHDKPVIVGGSRQRGVAMTACYVARRFGVKSAMPMFQALKLCPEAVVIAPRMSKYAEVARELRALMFELTPLVEPLSLDEAYLDLSGTERLHGASPAKTLVRLANRIEATLRITVSVGLSHNKLLAKLASELDKPGGFAVIGRGETVSFLRDKPVGIIRGVGAVLQARLAKDGFQRIGQIQDSDQAALARRYGETGLWLYRLAHGEDARIVDADGVSKSISAETTFMSDIADAAALERILWEQAERVSARAKAAELGGRTITLKLKTDRFRIKTRSISLHHPTMLAHVIFEAARRLLGPEADGTKYRLLGVGLSRLEAAAECDPPEMLNRRKSRLTAAEHAMDSVRAKFGDGAIRKGADSNE